MKIIVYDVKSVDLIEDDEKYDLWDIVNVFDNVSFLHYNRKFDELLITASNGEPSVISINRAATLSVFGFNIDCMAEDHYFFEKHDVIKLIGTISYPSGDDDDGGCDIICGREIHSKYDSEYDSLPPDRKHPIRHFEDNEM